MEPKKKKKKRYGKITIIRISKNVSTSMFALISNLISQSKPPCFEKIAVI